MRWLLVPIAVLLLAAGSAEAQTPMCSALLSNRPAGLVTYVDEAFDSVDANGVARLRLQPPTPSKLAYWAYTPGWATDSNTRRLLDTTTAGVARCSPYYVHSYRFPPGTVGSAGGGGSSAVFSDSTSELYVALWHRANSRYQYHFTGANKLILFGTEQFAGNFTNLILGLNGDSTALSRGAHYRLDMQGVTDSASGGCYAGRLLLPNVDTTRFAAGPWRKVELYMKGNTQTSAANGILRLWVDGVLRASYGNVCYRTVRKSAANQDSTRTRFLGMNVDPVWGGGGDVIRDSTSYHNFDHLYVAGGVSTTRYGDVDGDGAVTAADTVALRAILSRPDTVVDDATMLRANVAPANLPGRGDRGDVPPGRTRPHCWPWGAGSPRHCLNLDDLAELRRYLRSGAATLTNTVVGDTVPTWRLNGGVSMASGDLLPLGQRTALRLAPGTYRLYAAQAYPDSTRRDVGRPWEQVSGAANTAGAGNSYRSPRWIGVSVGSSLPSWAARSTPEPTTYAAAARPAARHSWWAEVASWWGALRSRAVVFWRGLSSGPTPAYALQGERYPGCSRLPLTLGDTVAVWMQPNNGSFTTTFDLTFDSATAVAANTAQPGRYIRSRLIVMARNSRVVIYADSSSVRFWSDLYTRASVEALFQAAARTLSADRLPAESWLGNVLPTSSSDTATRQPFSRNAPLIVISTQYPDVNGRGASAQVTPQMAALAACPTVRSVYYYRRRTFGAGFLQDTFPAIDVHEVGHVAHARIPWQQRWDTMTSVGFVPQQINNVAEGLAQLHGLRSDTWRRVPLGAAWTLSPATQDSLASGIPTRCTAPARDGLRAATNGGGLSYAESCAFILATVATAAARGVATAQQLWAEFPRGATTSSFDSLARRVIRLPLPEWYPQWVVAHLVKGRFAASEGYPYQMPAVAAWGGLVASDTVPRAWITSGGGTFRAAYRQDSTLAVEHLRITVGASDSAVVRLFTDSLNTPATAAALWNLRLILVRE